MSKEKWEKGKRIFLDIILLFNFPPFQILVRELDRMENDKTYKTIMDQIHEIWERMTPIEDRTFYFFKGLKLLQDHQLIPSIDLRKTKSCMVIIEELNKRSQTGQIHDPKITYDKCLEILKKKVQIDDLQNELASVVYELKRTGLIALRLDPSTPLGFYSIFPTEYFFCKTDHLFQKWNPKSDAIEIVRLLQKEKKESIWVQELDKILKWGRRRLNPALAYMRMKGWVKNIEEEGGQDYFLDRIHLSKEAYLALES